MATINIPNELKRRDRLSENEFDLYNYYILQEMPKETKKLLAEAITRNSPNRVLHSILSRSMEKNLNGGLSTVADNILNEGKNKITPEIKRAAIAAVREQGIFDERFKNDYVLNDDGTFEVYVSYLGKVGSDSRTYTNDLQYLRQHGFKVEENDKYSSDYKKLVISGHIEYEKWLEDAVMYIKHGSTLDTKDMPYTPKEVKDIPDETEDDEPKKVQKSHEQIDTESLNFNEDFVNENIFDKIKGAAKSVADSAKGKAKGIGVGRMYKNMKNVASHAAENRALKRELVGEIRDKGTLQDRSSEEVKEINTRFRSKLQKELDKIDASGVADTDKLIYLPFGLNCVTESNPFRVADNSILGILYNADGISPREKGNPTEEALGSCELLDKKNIKWFRTVPLFERDSRYYVVTKDAPKEILDFVNGKSEFEPEEVTEAEMKKAAKEEPKALPPHKDEEPNNNQDNSNSTELTTSGSDSDNKRLIKAMKKFKEEKLHSTYQDAEKFGIDFCNKYKLEVDKRNITRIAKALYDAPVMDSLNLFETTKPQLKVRLNPSEQDLLEAVPKWEVLDRFANYYEIGDGYAIISKEWGDNGFKGLDELECRACLGRIIKRQVKQWLQDDFKQHWKADDDTYLNTKEPLFSDGTKYKDCAFEGKYYLRVKDAYKVYSSLVGKEG